MSLKFVATRPCLLHCRRKKCGKLRFSQQSLSLNGQLCPSRKLLILPDNHSSICIVFCQWLIPPTITNTRISSNASDQTRTWTFYYSSLSKLSRGQEASKSQLCLIYFHPSCCTNMAKRTTPSRKKSGADLELAISTKEDIKRRERAGTESSIESVALDDMNDDDSVSKVAGGSSAPSSGDITKLRSKLMKAIIHIRSSSRKPKIDGKQIVLCCMLFMLFLIIWDSTFRDPEDRLLKPDFSNRFLSWVQLHPALGLGAILFVIAIAVVSMVPIGTPLTVGAGFIYRGVYGWSLGLFVATAVSMIGSTMGAVTCFLLGRYLMRDRVKRWVRNYPLFDAIDVGKAESRRWIGIFGFRCPSFSCFNPGTI